MFVGVSVHNFYILHQYLLGKILSFDHIVLGQDKGLMIHFGLLIHEMLKLHWPEMVFTIHCTSSSEQNFPIRPGYSVYNEVLEAPSV